MEGWLRIEFSILKSVNPTDDLPIGKQLKGVLMEE